MGFHGTGKTSLGVLIYEATEACNQNCRFCYNHWRPEGSSPVDASLARRTLKRILSQAEIGSVSLSGGEPMLLRNLTDLALRCRFAGSRVNVLTNGTLLTDSAIRNFGSIGISTLQIPLLSDRADIHEALTTLPGSWNKAVSSLRMAVDILGPEKVAAVLIITAANVDTLATTLDLYDRIGVRTVMVNRFNLGGNGLLSSSDLLPSGVALRSSFKVVSDFALAHPGMSFVSGVCTPMCVLNPSDYPGVRFTSCSTDLKSRPLAVNYRGDVRFCNHSPYVLGNVYERPIGEILTDETVLQRFAGVPSECGDCHLFERCKGGCRAASEQVHGTFDAVDPIVEYLKLT